MVKQRGVRKRTSPSTLTTRARDLLRLQQPDLGTSGTGLQDASSHSLFSSFHVSAETVRQCPCSSFTVPWISLLLRDERVFHKRTPLFGKAQWHDTNPCSQSYPST